MAAPPRDVQNFINSITDPRTRATAEQLFTSIVANGESMQKAFDRVKAAFGQATNSARQFRDELDGSLDLAKAISDELNKQEGPIVRAKKAMNGLVSIGQQLVDEEREIDALDERRLKRLAKEASLKLQTFQIEARNIAGRLTIDEKIVQNAQLLNRIANLGDRANTAGIAKLKKKAEEELNVLNAYKQQEVSYKAIQQAAEKRYKLEQATTKTFGLTGAAMATMSTVASKLGVGHLSEELDEVNQKLREEMRQEIEKNDGKVLSLAKKFEYAARGVASSARIIAKGFLDPLVIMGKIYDAFLGVNKAAVDYTRLSGINATNQAALNSRLATSVDYLETAAALTNQLGMSATSVFSNDDIAAMAEAKNLLGLTAEQAGELGIKSKLANTSIDSFQDNLLKGASAGNRLNNSLVAPGVAMQDVLNASEDITMSLGNNPIALGHAAVAARAFGLDLQKVNDIAETLLQFEDSIGNELEAELMTGKNLNLEKAREFALTNDLEGLSRELAKNGATAAEFSQMNRLEQESLAKALGMNREQLGKSILAQEASKNATLEQRAAVMGVTKEQMQSMDIQERMAKTIDKLAQAFAPILEAVVPIIEVFAGVLQPVAMTIGYIASGISAMIKPLMIVYGLYKSIQIMTTATLAVNRANYALKAMQMGQEAFISREKRVQGIMEKQSLGTRLVYNVQLLASLVSEQGILGLKTYASTLDEKSLARKVIMNTYDGLSWIYEKGKTVWSGIRAGYEAVMLSIKQRGLAVDIKDLSVSIGKAAMGAIASLSSIPVVGWALGLAAAGAVIGLGAKFMMKDGIIDPKKGPVVSGEFGTVQLDPNDQIAAGTNLIGNKSNKKPQTISQAVATNDNTHGEIKQMREENKSLLTALLNKSGNVYMDSNKVGKSQMIGNYKSS